MKSIKLTASKRDVFGRKVKKLREEGKIPANIFGKKIKSEAISVNEKEFDKAFEEAGETQIIDLSGKPVLVSNVQYGPVTGRYIHVDFRQVDLTEKITAEVPIEVVGESPAEKQGLGTLVVQIDEVEVEALPTDLPEKITIDVSSLVEVDQAIYVKDLEVGSKAKVMEDPDAIIAKVEPLREEEPEVVAPVEGEEGVEGEVPAEGEAPKEGEEAQEKGSEEAAGEPAKKEETSS